MIQGIQDKPSVDAAGRSLAALPAGVTFRPLVTHTDDRGTVFEMFDPRWNWSPHPLVFVYCFTLRPGHLKGWGMHERHEDRYCVLFGEMEVVMYDDRPDSPTRGQVSKAVLTEHHRRLMNIPPGVWHANHNIGAKDAIVVNLPSTPYDHAAPDKFRLPLDTDKIPYRFEKRTGW